MAPYQTITQQEKDDIDAALLREAEVNIYRAEALAKLYPADAGLQAQHAKMQLVLDSIPLKS